MALRVRGAAPYPLHRPAAASASASRPPLRSSPAWSVVGALALVWIASLMLAASAAAKELNATDASPSASPSLSNSTLVVVQVISRHGTRAPNPVVDHLCPADRANLALYGSLRITLAGLTGTGMKELYALGVFARQQYMERTYPGFLSSYFNDQEVYFRAVGEDRTLQSAVAMAQAMFPAGSAPVGYSAKRPSPVPVYTLPNEFDSLLEVRKEGCKARLARDAAQWDRTEGVALYAANQPLLKQMHKLCNISDLNDQLPAAGGEYNYGDAIKDITDAWTFDMIEGFTMQPGLNVTTLLQFRELAVAQLLGRIVGTDEQITYMNGALPERMVDNFLFAVWNQGPARDRARALKMYLYHGHREMTYALGALLGLDFDIDFPALPKGAIPPATTLFFELHYVGQRDANGQIPNAFEAAGLANPYEEAGVKIKIDSMEPKPMPWERKSASQTVRIQPEHSHDGGKLTVPASASTSAGQPPQHASTTVAKEKEKESAAAAAAFGADQLNRGNGVRFRLPTKSDEVAAAAAAAAGAGDERSYKYMPHAPSESASKAQERLPNGETPKEAASEWRPAPPTDGYVVRALLWHPCGEDAGAVSGKKSPSGGRYAKKSNRGDPSTPDCPATPIAMSAVCSAPAADGCALEDFSRAIHERIERTGTWDQLCGVKDPRRVMADAEGVAAALGGSLVGPAAAATVAVTPAAAAPAQSHPVLHFLLAVLLLVPLVGLSYLAFIKYRQLEYSEPRTTVDRGHDGDRDHELADHVLGFRAGAAPAVADEESVPLNDRRVY